MPFPLTSFVTLVLVLTVFAGSARAQVAAAPVQVRSAGTAREVAAKAPSPSPTRVFFSRMQTGEGVSASDGRIVADAVLVAARTREGFDVVVVSDLQNVMDLEASKQAAGCDVVSCASEIADALGAPQLVTGQLGRVGETWVITLTRLDRASLKVLGREQAQREGVGADAILGDVPSLVERLLPSGEPPPMRLLPVIGAVVGGVGLVATLVGAGLVISSAGIHQEGVVARAEGRFADAIAKADAGEPLYLGGWTAVGLGAAAVAVGVGVVVGLGEAP